MPHSPMELESSFFEKVLKMMIIKKKEETQIKDEKKIAKA